jgi:hypothetical protein
MKKGVVAWPDRHYGIGASVFISNFWMRLSGID